MPVFIGIVFTRTIDLMVVATIESVGDSLHLRSLERFRLSVAELKYAIRTRLERGSMRCKIDGSGLGLQVAEEMASEFGSRVEVVTISRRRMPELARPLDDMLASGRLAFDYASVEEEIRRNASIPIETCITEPPTGDQRSFNYWAVALSASAVVPVPATCSTNTSME